MSLFYRWIWVYLLCFSSISADQFASWNFVLWDTADEVVSTETAQAHWGDLIAFAQKNNPKRVITMIKNPSQIPFFDVQKQLGNQYFLYWAQAFAQAIPNCDLCVLFDRTAFTNPKLTLAVPTDLPAPFLKLSSTTFLNLSAKMSWTLAMLRLGAPIKEVDLDPECGPVGVKVGGKKGAKQLLINYMNYFRTQNATLNGIRLGVSLGFDDKALTFVNLSNLPLPSEQDEYNLDALLPAALNYYQFPTKVSPGNWWGIGSSRPLLDSIYVQVYNSLIPYNFTLQDNPQLAAANMLHLYRDEPYMPGKGTITLNTHSKQVVGKGTQFLRQGVVDGTPIGVAQKDSVKIAGKVNGKNREFPISATGATLNANSQVAGTNLTYFLSEVPIQWTAPSIDLNYNPQLTNQICLMFSLEPSYFGEWTLDAFLTFVSNFYQKGQSALPIYTQAMRGQQPVYLPLSPFFGIYDFKQIQTNKNYSTLLSK